MPFVDGAIETKAGWEQNSVTYNFSSPTLTKRIGDDVALTCVSATALAAFADQSKSLATIPTTSTATQRDWTRVVDDIAGR
jgi:hypothetical protein